MGILVMPSIQYVECLSLFIYLQLSCNIISLVTIIIIIIAMIISYHTIQFHIAEIELSYLFKNGYFFTIITNIYFIINDRMS